MATRYLANRDMQAAACALLNALHLTGNFDRFKELLPDVWAQMDRSEAFIAEDGSGDIIVTVYDSVDEMNEANGDGYIEDEYPKEEVQ